MSENDWPQYESHKIVRAAKIVGLLAHDDGGGPYRIFVRSANADPAAAAEEFWPSVDEMAMEAEGGAWAVLYDDGFKSISPAKAFEEGYSLFGGYPIAESEVAQTLAADTPSKRLVTHKDVVGQLARWAIQQHPYGAPEGLFELSAKIAEAAQSWDIGPPSLKMREFEGWLEVERWIADVLLDHPILKAWNTPRSGHDAPFVAVSRYWSVKPEHDFIDIDALLRNVARSVWARSHND